MLNEQTLDAFEQMWGPFPEPVMLIQRDRTILAANELARTAGFSIGLKCYSLNPEAVSHACKNCKANLALREHHPVCTEQTENGKRVVGYWVPLKDEPDVYVHLGIGTAAVMGIEPYPTIQLGEPNLVRPNH